MKQMVQLKILELERNQKPSKGFNFLSFFWVFSCSSMDILSLNCCGFCSEAKQSWIRNLILSEKVEFLGLQETKSESMPMEVLSHLWGSNRDWDYSFSPSIGLSGGLLTTWKTNIFTKEIDFITEHYVCVLGKWRGVSSAVALVNIYAPQENSLKNNLWLNLSNLMENIARNRDVIWILFGDMNSVRSHEERMGCLFDTADAFSFNSFINSNGLHDFPLGNRKFTRISKNGQKLSKLDRFLVSDNFFFFWNDASVKALVRSLSDHAPIILSSKTVDAGPKSFKIFNQWLEETSFRQLVLNTWNDVALYGTPDVQLKNKFKRLKEYIKIWCNEEMLNKRKKKEDIQSFLQQWDEIAECNSITEELVNKREEAILDLQKFERIEREHLRQKSRLKWAIEGDENTRFFHSYINCRRKNSNIKGISQNGIWITDPKELKELGRRHFKNRFTELIFNRPNFRSNNFRKLDESDVSFLEQRFSEDEIDSAVKDCSSNKAPGPDGISFSFIKSFWSVIKADFYNFLNYFHHPEKIARGCNASCIVLVPKVNDPLSFSDYRPISLIGCMYKILSKLLANRLSKVISKLISFNQTAFIKGRQILDGAVIANEIIKYASEVNIKLLLLKVDFEKAFDCVNWCFLLDIMKQMGFGLKWCNWIFSCLSSASISILINGSPSDEFQMERGLRQGDPLSPFLFLLVAESLQVMMIEACSKGLFEGVFLSESKANLSLLQFADDAIFFGRWSYSNASNLLYILKCFQVTSGLKVNISKSCIYGIGVDRRETEEVARKLKCLHGSLPFSYLGLPVGLNMNRVQNWNVIIERFSNRLNAWKANSLSIGGRHTLVKTVLGSLPLYFFSLFKAPKKVIQILERIRMRFFWGHNYVDHKLNLIAWNKVLISKERGGLGIESLEIKIFALLSKWYWRFLNEPKALWRQVIQEFYGNKGGFDDTNENRGKFGIWSNICKCVRNLSNLGIDFSSFFSKKIGDGADTYFWKDRWCSRDNNLGSLFPRLFALEVNKDCLVAERTFSDPRSVISHWRCSPRGRAKDEFDELIKMISGVSLDSNKRDRWWWHGCGEGTFSVKSCYKMMEEKLLFPGSLLINKFEWNSWLPKKINIFYWRLTMNGIPVLSELARRGVRNINTICPLCNADSEILEHAFLSCDFVRPIWRKWWAWWKPLQAFNLNFEDLVSLNLQVPPSKRASKVLKGSAVVLLWAIWCRRNKVVHELDDINKEKLRHEDPFLHAQSSAFLWLSNRNKSAKFEWETWLKDPNSIM